MQWRHGNQLKVILVAHAMMNKGRRSIQDSRIPIVGVTGALGDGPVTRLEECTWNDGMRVGGFQRFFGKALFSSEYGGRH